MLFAIVLQSCAPVVAPASSAPFFPASLPADCLDLQGQRELLAGVELELGSQAAALARCNVQRGAAVKYGDGQAQRAQTAEGQLRWAIPVTGVGGVVLGAAIAAVAVWASTQQPKNAGQP